MGLHFQGKDITYDFPGFDFRDCCQENRLKFSKFGTFQCCCIDDKMIDQDI